MQYNMARHIARCSKQLLLPLDQNSGLLTCITVSKWLLTVTSNRSSSPVSRKEHRFQHEPSKRDVRQRIDRPRRAHDQRPAGRREAGCPAAGRFHEQLRV